MCAFFNALVVPDVWPTLTVFVVHNISGVDDVAGEAHTAKLTVVLLTTIACTHFWLTALIAQHILVVTSKNGRYAAHTTVAYFD